MGYLEEVTNYVIGMYDNLDINTPKGGLLIFLQSLRKFNSTCEVIIINSKPETLKDLAEKYNFSIYKYNPENYEGHIQSFRFLIYKKIINERCIKGNILLCDMNDVLFAGDPFSIDFPMVRFTLQKSLIYFPIFPNC